MALRSGPDGRDRLHLPLAIPLDTAGLERAAEDVLRRNDRGGWTSAAPHLYPHQWSWDSAFIAIGLAQVDVERAITELEGLLGAQWANGMIPHIHYADDGGDYIPEASRWDAQALAPDAAGTARATSGICQPPVHALAVGRILESLERGGDAGRVKEVAGALFPRLLAWHRFLATVRDPGGTGLVTIYHPWESGTDNSPRWDFVIGQVLVGDMPPYLRYDLHHVTDPTQRPSDHEYDVYLWLLGRLKAARYDDHVVRETHPFRVKDVLFSAILVAANGALIEIGKRAGAPEEELRNISSWIDRGRKGIASRWNAELGLCLDWDERAGAALHSRTFAGLCPLVAGEDPQRDRLLAGLDRQTGSRDLACPLLPSAFPEDPGFRSRSYWRGPTWPVITWLIWDSLTRHGDGDRAEAMRVVALEQLAEYGFYEYFEPATSEPLGSPDQSWTAAVALDWLRGGRTRGETR